MSAHPTPGRAELRTAPSATVEPLRPDPEEVARYVGQMAAELGALARSAKLDVLAYFLDMARVEAASIRVRG